MNRLPTFSLLLLLNLGLIGWLAAQLTDRSDTRESAWNKTNRGEHGSETVSTTAANTKAIPPTKASSAAARSEKSELSVTPFAQVYSPDPKLFAANLRAAGCPEETIKDILTAEVHRWYQNQEQALRPTPADHVPFAWSAKTSEPRLIDRRQKAGELARDESSILRNALSCDISVPLPLYATTFRDQQFEASYAGSANACAIREVQDIYWTRVQALQQRIKDFWLPEDVAELDDLKAQRRQALSGLLDNQ